MNLLACALAGLGRVQSHDVDLLKACTKLLQKLLLLLQQ